MYETFQRTGTIRNNFMHIFELLLRLRQACDHNYLVLLCLLKKKKGNYAEAAQILKEMLVSIKNGEKDYANAVVQRLFNNVNSVCSICWDEMDDAHTTTCGHLFCKECIEDWLDRNQTCPMCRAGQTADTLVPRRVAEDQVTNFRAEREKAAKLLENEIKDEVQVPPTIFDVNCADGAKVSLKNSKLEALLKELQADPKRKSLVFCQFTMVNNLRIFKNDCRSLWT
jgi:SNF2 family DNA or RNA helicase